MAEYVNGIKEETSEGKVRRWNPANGLTLLRIIISPLFVYLLWDSSPLRNVLAALLFAFAGATDFLDGYFARKLGMVTRLGQFLDPLADKIYISTVLIMLFHLGRIYWWVPVVIIGRELIITAMRVYAGSRGVSVPATMLAKLKTNTQFLAIILITFHFPVDRNYLHESVALWLAIAFTLVSGLDYILRLDTYLNPEKGSPR